MKIKSIYQHLYNSLIKNNKKIEKPIVIQFPVIDICNSRCQMCRIWENKKSQDITVDALEKGLNSELFDRVEAIGFNGGEPTLRGDLIELVRIAIKKLPNLRSVSLITNAYKYNQVIEQITKIGELLNSHGKYFDVMVSLDGYEEVHDKVRGRSGNFENAKKVLTFLTNNNNIDVIRIGCTVIRENVYYLADLFEFCVENNLYIKYRQGVPHQRLYTENLLDPYALTFEEKYEFVEFLEGLIKYYEPSYLQRFFYRSLIDQILYNKPRAAGCDWQYRGATITAKGELAYCAVKSKAIMNDISDGDPKYEYFSNQSHLNQIIKNSCDNCHHDYVGLPTPLEYRKMLYSRLNEKFNIKRKIKKIPGFNLINNLRTKNHYLKQLNNYRKQPNLEKNDIKSNINILICGWYGTETLGDKGIIGGVMYALRKKLGQDINFTLVSLFPYISMMTRKQMPEFHNTKIVDTKEGICLAHSMDFVVFGGGPLMAIDALAPMQVIFERAKQNNIKTIIAGCGVGPLGAPWHNESIATILNLADIRIYRDVRSKEYASKIGVNSQNDAVAEDPAFTWLANINNQCYENQINTEHEVLLLGLRDFPYKEYARHLSEVEAITIKNNYEKIVIEALSDLTQKRPNLIIRPLPMCTNHYGSDDRWFYRQLFRGNNALKENLDFSLLGKEMAPTFYCEEFRKANALLAMRFHSLVFGIGLGINSVGLDYTLGKGKVRSLAEKFGTPLLSMQNLDKQQLVSLLESALDTPSPKPISFEQLTFEEQLLKKWNEI
uniref:Polysaccharide pyruvyl transferase family protein n=1 Tax=Providencia stuartii TaxID=588 RepID=A0AAI9DEF3_PROST|nr:polysaccharide pyruvyl transferase family protein [Providencia stuartii]